MTPTLLVLRHILLPPLPAAAARVHTFSPVDTSRHLAYLTCPGAFSRASRMEATCYHRMVMVAAAPRKRSGAEGRKKGNSGEEAMRGCHSVPVQSSRSRGG
ncbi:unnamed protein product [Pleuronectes platessa]|uniref:Secreted protein n=1 Tax=Pleuronectes platessa TaxID=8262 RepID=A0A9N7YD05_PLEPL|nr:unnamed protein product [Pleuronectes platessa]